MKMTNLFATMILASTLATVSAFADEGTPVVPVDNGVKQELSKDKATVKADKTQLKTDKQKLREDRKAARMARKGKAHKRSKKDAQPVVQEQPKNG
jgi:ABC-type transporter MlaC component